MSMKRKAAAAMPAPGNLRHRRLSLERRKVIAGYLFILPFVVGFCVFLLFPLLTNLRLSFGERTNTMNFDTRFVGFKNYAALFGKDVKFMPAFLDTFQKTFLGTPFVIVFSLFLAVVLNRDLKGKGLFRLIFFLPVLLGSGYVMQYVGGAASVLRLPEAVDRFITESLSGTMSDFLKSMLEQVLSSFWSSGVQIVIFLSGLQSISDTYYEAARIDGAGSIQQFWKISLPLLSPVILLNVVYTIIESFRSTDNAIADLIVKTAFGEDGRHEYGAAMGWIYFVVVLVAVGLVFAASRAMVKYEK